MFSSRSKEKIVGKYQLALEAEKPGLLQKARDFFKKPEEPEVVDNRSFAEVWKEVEARLKEHHPDAMKEFNPPATSAQIAAVQKIAGGNLPADYVAFLRMHNGQDSDKHSNAGLFGRMLTTDEVLEEHHFLDENHTNDERHDRAVPDKGIKPLWYNEKWIPFAEGYGGGDAMCFDLDPAAGGTKGQVVEFVHDDEHRSIHGSSFKQWLVKQLNRKHKK